jgi:hypothetical protein
LFYALVVFHSGRISVTRESKIIFSSEILECVGVGVRAQQAEGR